MARGVARAGWRKRAGLARPASLGFERERERRIALSCTCASLAAFGITTTLGWRKSHASAIRAGDAPSLAAIFFSTGCVRRRPRIAAERRIGHQRHAVFAAPRQNFQLDAALLEVVEHLIRRDAAPLGSALGFVESSRSKLLTP